MVKAVCKDLAEIIQHFTDKVLVDLDYIKMYFNYTSNCNELEC